MKDFALGAVAARRGAVGVNLLIDSDLVKNTSLRVPGGSIEEPAVAMIPLDRAEPRVPYEERRVVDRRTFAEFGQRAAEQLALLVPDPLVASYWPLAVSRLAQTDNLGACLAQSRHLLEGRWGLSTLEVPQSWICETESFAWFAVHLLARLPRLREAYNAALGEYRRVHRIRGAGRPAPDLAADGPWLEAPLWMWTAQRPERRRLFARSDGAAVSPFRSSGVGDSPCLVGRRRRARGGRATVPVAREGCENPLPRLADDPLGAVGAGRSISPRHRRRQVRSSDRPALRAVLRRGRPGNHGDFGDAPSADCPSADAWRRQCGRRAARSRLPAPSRDVRSLAR